MTLWLAVVGPLGLILPRTICHNYQFQFFYELKRKLLELLALPLRTNPYLSYLGTKLRRMFKGEVNREGCWFPLKQGTMRTLPAFPINTPTSSTRASFCLSCPGFCDFVHDNDDEDKVEEDTEEQEEARRRIWGHHPLELRFSP
ncbi:hypothetical protein L6164_028699 [Bauhinia variegata]|uniref:Uncharacterized protein n=1 Tax=Bauhinia variegata TaxID=167791 RepID=A0ACB9L6Y6_BAUVA|nr:hypothetical protein L6164_028699 [Bauhinia variegata]